jgi:hypothetical protein
MADFIPAGRTSRIVKGSKELQIQTEYACRPSPRLTTSVISKGQVVHKIQQDLVEPIGNFEEKAKVETLLRKQHLEVLEIVRKKDFSEGASERKEPDKQSDTITLTEKLAKIEGVDKVYRLDNQGNFDSPLITEEFRSRFSYIFRTLGDIIKIFGSLSGGIREHGVVEIEPNRLYLFSNGYEYYFLLTRRIIRKRELLQEIRDTFPD